MDQEYTAMSCPSEDGRHVLAAAAAPWYAVCTVCEQRFALISESVMRGADLEPRERDVEIPVRH